MRVVVRTTTGSSADSAPVDPSAAESGGAGTESADPAAEPSAGSSPAPSAGEASATGPAPATGSDAEETESRPRRVPAADNVTCHGFSEGQHGLQLTDANGEKCGYVPYDELLRVVPE